MKVSPESGDTADYTVKEFARVTKQSDQVVYRKIRAGQIPSYKVGGAVRIRREDVEQIRQPRTREAAVTDRTQEYIERVLATAPPLSEEQRARLAELLAPLRGGASG